MSTIHAQTLAAHGTFPHVGILGDTVYVAAQTLENESDRFLVVWSRPRRAGSEASFARVRSDGLGRTGQAFPIVGGPGVIYRGADDTLRLLELPGGTPPEAIFPELNPIFPGIVPGPPIDLYGNHPIAIRQAAADQLVLLYQQETPGPRRIISRRLTPGVGLEISVRDEPPVGTGLAGVSGTGAPLFVDDYRTIQTFLGPRTRPSFPSTPPWEGLSIPPVQDYLAYAVEYHQGAVENGGVECWVQWGPNGTRLVRLWDTQPSFTPCVAYDALTDLFYVVTWGGSAGVRVAWFPSSVLRDWQTFVPKPIPPPTTTPPPRPTIPTKITFAEPREFTLSPPQTVVVTGSGTPVRCVYKTTQGAEPATVVWKARAATGKSYSVQNPGWDHDHTWRLELGDWILGIEAYDARGRIVDATGTPRILSVLATDPIPPPGTTPPPDPIDPGQPLPPDIGHWQGNMFAFPGFPLAFMFPGWSAEKQRAFLAAYRDAGYRDLAFAPWGRYDKGGPPFNFRTAPATFASILADCASYGIRVCVMLQTDAVPELGAGPFTRAEAQAWANEFVPRLLDYAPWQTRFCTGWESVQIDQGYREYWMNKGDQHLAYARHLRSLIGPTRRLYAHFPPDRITGYPNYPDHSGPQNEEQWWIEAGSTLTGLLWQGAPDKPEWLIEANTVGGLSVPHNFDGPLPDRLRPGQRTLTDRHGHEQPMTVDVGDFNRIGRAYSDAAGTQFEVVGFEFARIDLDVHARARHERLTQVWANRGQSGYCGFC